MRTARRPPAGCANIANMAFNPIRERGKPDDLTTLMAMMRMRHLMATPIRTHGARVPKKKTPSLSDKEQYRRFKEAAEKAGVTKDEEEFKKAFKAVTTKSPGEK